MAHHVYNTEGFIVESSPSGEANKLFTVFTKDLGMIRATAQGVRLSKSKLKAALQDLSLAKISVVRGKDIWRITNAKAEENYYHIYKHNKDVLFIFAQVFALLKRLIPGEQKDEILFILIRNALEFLKEKKIDGEHAKAFERILVMRMLQELGYMSAVSELQEFLGDIWSDELIQHMIEKKKFALQEINSSIRETQL